MIYPHLESSMEMNDWFMTASSGSTLMYMSLMHATYQWLATYVSV